jgi:SAM-dependent methyltransferase
MQMDWSLPPGWKGKLSASKGRWYFWNESDPSVVTWTPPSWNDSVAASYNAHLQADPRSELFRTCQNFCKSAVLNLFLFRSLQDSAHVLDMGCGKGGDAGKVPAGIRVTGFDIATDALAEARRRFPQHTYVEADFCKPLPFSDGAFDAAWSSFAFHYAGDCLDVALRSVKSILKPGGFFVFIVLDEDMETRYPQGFGPLRITRWEHRDVGAKGVCASSSKCWVSFDGSFSNLPENILTRAQVEAACAASKLTLVHTERLASCVQLLFDWATTPAEQASRAALEALRDRYKHRHMWDSTHYEFANCYRVWVLKA